MADSLPFIVRVILNTTQRASDMNARRYSSVSIGNGELLGVVQIRQTV